MAQELYKVSVPGSMMLMGEHAVLEGMQSLVCAVNKRITLELIPHSEATIIINDTRLGTLRTQVNTLCVQEPFKFVTAALLSCQDEFPQGCTINICAQFASNLGLGSSAAVTVGTIALLHKWLRGSVDLAQIFDHAKQIIRHVQGIGSGADVAASVFGGVVGYTLQDMQQLPLLPNLTAIYCGYKTPTPEVIQFLHVRKQQDPQKYSSLFQEIDACAKRSIDAIKSENWSLLGSLFTQHHALQARLGVSNDLLDQLVATLNQQPEILGAKISGAGLGDCVIGIGTLARQIVANDGMVQFPVTIDSTGVAYANN